MAGRVLVLAPAQSWSHRPSHRRTKPPGRRRTTLCAISARETPGEQAQFFRFSQLVTCCDKVLSGINSVFKSFGRIVGNEWVGELMTTMNCDRRKPGEQVWYPSVSNIRYTFFNLLCWRWCLSLSWPPTCWDLKFDYLAGRGKYSHSIWRPGSNFPLSIPNWWSWSAEAGSGQVSEWMLLKKKKEKKKQNSKKKKKKKQTNWWRWSIDARSGQVSELILLRHL